MHSFIHSAVCLTTGPQPLPRSFLHTVRPSKSSFNMQYPLLSLRSLGSCLPLLPRLPVTSILPSTFPSITCLRRQFHRNVWPIQLADLLFIVYRTFLSSLSLCNTSSFLTRSVQLFFSILLQHHISKLPNRPSNRTNVIYSRLFSICELHVSAYRSHHQTWTLNTRQRQTLINNKLICKTADSSVL